MKKTLQERILNKETGYLFYGLTPPKTSTEKEKLPVIAAKQIERIQSLDLDALVLYDIQDESSRNNDPRPFPFMSTLAPDFYAKEYLSDLKIPKVIYKSVGKHSSDTFSNWLQETDLDLTVFVGAPSKNQETSLTLNDAYKVKEAVKPNTLLGGITIPERHFVKQDEHKRLENKVANGCQFFISQCVYNLDNAKDVLSDYYFYAKENNLELKPIIFTLTPIGSLKTLQFTKWLGIDIQRWLVNELKASDDILRTSINICKFVAQELVAFAAEKQIPIGFNIESVAIRKAEIDASIELTKAVGEMMK